MEFHYLEIIFQEFNIIIFKRATRVEFLTDFLCLETSSGTKFWKAFFYFLFSGVLKKEEKKRNLKIKKKIKLIYDN